MSIRRTPAGTSCTATPRPLRSLSRSGTGPEAATVQRVRLARQRSSRRSSEIRALLRARGRGGAEWELGESCTPGDLVERLAGARVHLDRGRAGRDRDGAARDAVGKPAGRIPLRGEWRRSRSWSSRAGSSTRRSAPPGTSASTEAGPISRREGRKRSNVPRLRRRRARRRAYAAYTRLGLILFGGATLPSARGRGASPALVAARRTQRRRRSWHARARHAAGQMSRPILERLGFKPVARIDRLIDVLD